MSEQNPAPPDFTAMLNERLPRKRAIAQGLARDGEGHVLVCELTYKREWDLPGGVVDPLPPYKGWDDAVLFLFDLGVLDPATLDPSRFLAREIRAVHWAPVPALGDHMAPYAVRLVKAALGTEHTAYLEDGRPRDGGRG
jgi:hypothetical protein